VQQDDWANCTTGTLLAQAVPANYAGDPLLTNWTKPSYNPIIESTQRDPSTPWQTPSGEWRLRTYDSMVYGAASAADVLAGKWYTIGKSGDFRQCECPSVYPLPAPTPGTEAAYAAAKAAGALPDTVHKTSCGGDWWQVGSYVAGPPKTLGSFNATPGWEDLFEQRRIDEGNFYASKDNEYPTLSGGKRRINWGWATVPPASTQTLPREITFNAAARALQQYPIDELKSLRGEAAYNKEGVSVAGDVAMGLDAGVARQSEVVVLFELPQAAGSFGVSVGDGGDGGAAAVECTVDYTPGATTVPVECGGTKDTLTLLPSESQLELRLFFDWTFVEAYFQRGRVAITKTAAIGASDDVWLHGPSATVRADATAYPIKSIWVDAGTVRSAPRVYH